MCVYVCVCVSPRVEFDRSVSVKSNLEDVLTFAENEIRENTLRSLPTGAWVVDAVKQQ